MKKRASDETIIFKKMLGDHLNDLLEFQGLTAEDIVRTGEITRVQIYSVLQMGEHSERNYSVDTMVRVLAFTGAKIAFTSGSYLDNATPNKNIMRYSEKRVAEVKKVIAKHRRVADRENELLKKGYTIAEKPMGSGGTGKIKILKSEIRMQIGYAHGKGNYAKCVIFSL